VVIEDKVLVIRRIQVSYLLRGCPEEKREAAERAHALHVQRCPVARTIGACVDIRTDLAYA
jgi:uncharacterized OsmC-like protein